MTRKQIGLVLIFLLALFSGVWVAHAQSGEVLVLEIEGPVTPAMESYFQRGIAAGEAEGATAVLIILNTPGGAVDTTTDIIQLFRNANVPIIVFITPSGAQAASAGSIITIAAHASGMSPETVIGAASPVGGEGEDLEETLYRKLTEDMKAQVRGLAERRGAGAVALAEAMIEDARAVHASEALEVGLIDAIATDVPDLLAQLDGLPVVVNGREITLHTANAATRPFNMNTLELILHVLANPLLLSILLAIGVQAILIELSSPGGWVAGFIGVLSLILAAYGLGQLPINWLGLVLVLGAIVLFVAEVLATNHGALGVTGA
ncbi:MAG: nodulation protein NfeD, partial [Anaerolineales bacterium]|nr:nodulation protein NfeD [Anaerolineales bacterium]